MLRQLIADAWSSRSLKTIKTLRVFRHVREKLGDQPGIDFLSQQYKLTAERCHVSVDEVRRLTTDWLEKRPLPFLAATRYPYLQELFSALHACEKRVAVFSDYPAVEKVSALGLRANPIVCSTDSGVARLKPDPAGLIQILKQCEVPSNRALMIGDRFDRDALAASRSGVRALIRSRQPHPDFDTFQNFGDAVFSPLLHAHALGSVV
jgi:phosphoglycolate phosphatase